MSKTAVLELSNLTGPVPGREVKVVWEHRETPSREKQVPSPAPSLAVRLRAHLSSLTALESHALFSLLHRQATDEDTLLKCAAGETGVSEALIVKIAKKLGFEGFRQFREALGEHSRWPRRICTRNSASLRELASGYKRSCALPSGRWSKA
jgi:hypothetical protein